jgi:glycosyltransferase involved in cell wall biosynthesis
MKGTKMDKIVLDPAVTIIIATYNCSTTLKCAIESVLNQDFKDFEVWVIGDCCTDNSWAVVEEFNDPRLNWHNLPYNIGSQAGPNNEGLKRAKGKYIAYLGHDDLWFPNHIRSLISHIETADLDFVHCLSVLIKPEGAYSVIGPPPLGRSYLNCHVAPSSWLYKKNLTEDCGYWSNANTIGSGVDQDYLNRLAKAGKKIGYLPELFVLKFVSVDWSIYSKKDNFPQIDFLKNIQREPSEITLKILFELALEHSRNFRALPSIKESVRKLLRDSVFVFFNFYSKDRWPLNHLLPFLFQKARKKARKKRGLTD